jgi:DICT domain-containing protein
MEDANQPGKIMILVRPMWYGGSAQDFGNLADRVGQHAVVNASHTPATKADAGTARIAELEAETKDLKARLADLERLVTAQMQGNKIVSQR